MNKPELKTGDYRDLAEALEARIKAQDRLIDKLGRRLGNQRKKRKELDRQTPKKQEPPIHAREVQNQDVKDLLNLVNIHRNAISTRGKAIHQCLQDFHEKYPWLTIEFDTSQTSRYTDALCMLENSIVRHMERENQ